MRDSLKEYEERPVKFTPLLFTRRGRGRLPFFLTHPTQPPLGKRGEETQITSPFFKGGLRGII